MFGYYPVFINRFDDVSNYGMFFCSSCQGLARVNVIEFNVPVGNSELRTSVSVPRCAFHENELTVNSRLTDLMSVVPKEHDGHIETMRDKLNQEYALVKTWDRAFCVLSLMGGILIILGLGALFTVTSLAGAPPWILGFGIVVAGVISLSIAVLCLYKSGKTAGLWKVHEREFLDSCHLRSFLIDRGYDKYRILIDNFCILESN